VRFVAKRYILQQKCLKGQTGTFLVQRLALYIDPESHNSTALQTDGQRDGGQTDDIMMPMQ